MRKPVVGDKELVAALRVLGKGLPNAVIDRSLKQAAEPMTSEVVNRVRQHRQPKQPKGGHLDQNIKLYRKKESTKKRRSFVFGASGKRKSILTWLEYGTTGPYWQPKRRMIHPGSRPFPTMRPAFDTHADGINERFGRIILDEIAALIMKLNRGPRRR